jgi:predicted DNA-binding transcriptional regulator YafY
VDLDLDEGWLLVEAPAALGPPMPLTTLDAALLLGSLRSLGRGPGGLAARAAALADALADAIGLDRVAALDGTLAWASAESSDRSLADALAVAAAGGDEVEATFWNASRDRMETRPFFPEVLIQHTGLWYAVGRTESGRRFLRLDRILSATPTGRREASCTPDPGSLRQPWLFTPPPAPVRADVRFARARRAAARAWFPDAASAPNRPDVLVIETPTWPTLLRDLFAFGDGWEILAPGEARDLARAWAEKVGVEG